MGSRGLMVVILLLFAGGVGAWCFREQWLPGTPTPEQAQAGGTDVAPGQTGPADGNTNDNNAGAPGDGGADKQETIGPPTASAAQKAEAQRFYRIGLAQLGNKKPFEARRYLSQAVLSGHLSPADDHSAVLALTELANKYVLSPRIDPLDEYSAEYIMLDSDSKGLAYLARKLKLKVPWQCVMIISDGALTDLVHQRKAVDLALIEKKARRVNIGQSLKTINGAFHGIIYKSRHIMDLYLHRPGGDKIFVRRVPVALGKHGCTPSGTWVVASREFHPNYTPGPNSPLRKHAKGRGYIAYGEEHYAFGTKGLWIALRGTSNNTRIRKGYGIHSTNNQDSIGTDASEGCIRVADNDIELVYCLLYHTNAGSETKASTIDIRE